MNKKISIVTVVKNMAEDIEKCLNKYRKIKSENVEVVVVDGDSNDGTKEILKASEDIVDFWISESDSGIYDAMNKGVKISSGDLVVLINVDDLVIPENFDIALQVLEKNYDEFDIFAFSASMVINRKRKFKRIPRALDSSMLFRTMPFSHNATFIKRSVYDELGLYRTDFKIVSDFFWFCYAQSAGKRVYIEDLTILESDLTGMSGSNDDILCEENMKVLKNFFPFLNNFELKSSYFFRKKYSGSNDSLNIFDLITASKKSVNKGGFYHDSLKSCINEKPLSFVGSGYDILIKNLPRNHESRSILPSPIVVDEPELPLVTIGITAFNCAKTICETIVSCLNQSYQNFEVVIVDDCSNDDTLDVIKSFCSDKIKLHVNDRNRGVAYSRNKIAYKARGEYVMFCDDDDVSAENRLLISLSETRKFEKVKNSKRVICFSTRQSIQLDGKIIEIDAAGKGAFESSDMLHDLVALHLLRVCGEKGDFAGKDISHPLSVGTGTGFYPTELIRDIGFNEMFRRAEDIEFCMACGCEKEPVFIVGTKEPLYIQKITQSSDKGKDTVFGFYILLSVLYRSELGERGFDSRSFIKKVIKKVEDQSLKMDLYALLEFSNKWVNIKSFN